MLCSRLADANTTLWQHVSLTDTATSCSNKKNKTRNFESQLWQMWNDFRNDITNRFPMTFFIRKWENISPLHLRYVSTLPGETITTGPRSLSTELLKTSNASAINSVNWSVRPQCMLCYVLKRYLLSSSICRLPPMAPSPQRRPHRSGSITAAHSSLTPLLQLLTARGLRQPTSTQNRIRSSTRAALNALLSSSSTLTFLRPNSSSSPSSWARESRFPIHTVSTSKLTTNSVPEAFLI